MTTWPGGSSADTLASAVADIIPYRNVKWHGALGNGSNDDTAEIQAAITSLATTGGTVYFPPGTYKITAPLTYPPRVNLVGAGMEASTLSWATDLGSAYALAPSGAVNVYNNNYIRDLQLKGPASFNYGTDGCVMNGLLIQRRTTMQSCQITRFHSAVTFLQDHGTISDSILMENYYGISWGAGSTTFEDHVVENTFIPDCAMACLFCAVDNGMENCLFSNVHMGYSPYGMLRATGTPTRHWMVDCVFIDTAFEVCGNAGIFGPNTGAGGDRITGCTFIGGYPPTISTGGAYKDPATAVKNAVISVARLERCKFGFGGLYNFFSATSSGATGFVEVTWDAIGNDFDNLDPSYMTAAKPIFSPTGSGYGNRYSSMGLASGRIVQLTGAGGAVVVGDVLQIVGYDTAKKATTGTVLGISQVPGDQDDFVLAATGGTALTKITGTVAAGDKLILDTAASGALKAATGAAGEYIVAVAAAGGTNTTVMAYLRIE